MTMLKPHPLQTLLEAISEDVGPYSGRSMYGEKCVAISGMDIGDLMADLMLEAAELGAAEREQVVEAIRGLRTDSMGRGQVVYFPAVAHFDHDEMTPCCEFDECEFHAVEERAPFCYCAQHAAEYDAMVAAGRTVAK